MFTQMTLHSIRVVQTLTSGNRFFIILKGAGETYLTSEVGECDARDFFSARGRLVDPPLTQLGLLRRLLQELNGAIRAVQLIQITNPESSEILGHIWLKLPAGNQVPIHCHAFEAIKAALFSGLPIEVGDGIPLITELPELWSVEYQPRIHSPYFGRNYGSERPFEPIEEANFRNIVVPQAVL